MQFYLYSDIPSYILQKIDEEEFSFVVQYLKSSEKLLAKIAQSIVCALTTKVIQDFQLSLKIVDENSIDIMETKGMNINNLDDDEGDEDDMKLEREKSDPAFVMVDNKNIEIDFKNSLLNIDNYTLENPCIEMDHFIKAIDTMSKNGCNASHEMQNLSAPFIRMQPNNEIAKQIVGIAGQMENQWRNIQAQLYNFKNQYKTHTNVDALKRNLCTNTQKQIDGIVLNLEKISKLKFDSIEAIEGSMQVLIAVFRNNFKLQFGL